MIELEKKINEINDNVTSFLNMSSRILKHQLLPDEYQQVEYLKSTGTQYIDTKHIASINTGIELDIKFEGNFIYKDTNKIIFGARNSGNSEVFCANFGADPTQGTEIFNWNRPFNGVNSYSIYVTNTITKNRNIYKFQGTTVKYSSKSCYVISKNKNGTYPIFIFACNKNGEISIFNCYQMVLYRAKLYEDNNIVCDLIPCYRKLDNKSGMFNLVNGEFFINQGTNEFILGPKI